jgi:hypothetical protein
MVVVVCFASQKFLCSQFNLSLPAAWSQYNLILPGSAVLAMRHVFFSDSQRIQYEGTSARLCFASYHATDFYCI